MRRTGSLLLVFPLLAAPCLGRSQTAGCGTYRDKGREVLFLHRQSGRQRAATVAVARPAAAPPAANRDIGSIAIIEDADGVVARQNQFNLYEKTLVFLPSAAGAARYRYQVSDNSYDTAAATAGAPLTALGDDDTRSVALPFAFPFFGVSYRTVFVNSDGNLTFGAPDTASTDRSLGRLAAGAPRIAALFDDLDPSRTPGGVRVLAESGRVVVSWVAVPEYQDFGFGLRQTFQARLYPDGRIEIAYADISASEAVVGIAPGNLSGSTTLVSFRFDASGEYSSTVAERFGDTQSVDIVRVAQKFYETHEDAYDYLVIYNNMGIMPGASAVAYEVTVRNSRTGYGDTRADDGRQYGSASRLQALLNLGPLSSYPLSLTELVPLRAPAGDTPLSIIAHETGHLFLAYASVRDPADPAARPMLGAQMAHWSFAFDSEASLAEGERIRDDGADARPRFTTTGTSEWYAPLDQYLMGFRAAEEVMPPVPFLVTGVSASFAQQHPARNVQFNGGRRDISMQELIAAEGRRTPDYTVAQRRFRFGFILVAPQGWQADAAQLAQVEAYRAAFEPYYAQAASGRATADATLKRSLKLSLFPAAGVLRGGTATASLAIESAASAPLAVTLQTQNGNAVCPASVVIPAGAKSASFTLSGTREGVEEVTATPSDAAYETAFARVQVASPTAVKLVAVSGGQQVAVSAGPLPDPVVVRVTDINNLPYPGARVVASVSAGGAVGEASVATDQNGQAAFHWTPGPGPVNGLQLAVEGVPAASLAFSAGSAVVAVTAVMSAAAPISGMAPGSLATLYGVNLGSGTSTRVLVNGRTVPVLYAGATQVNFYVPEDTPVGDATVAVEAPGGTSAALPVSVTAVLPAIFPDGNNPAFGAILVSGSAKTTSQQPAPRGGYVEIYATGLGTGGAVPVVYINGLLCKVVYSGPAPGFPGLYQVNVQVPADLPAGPHAWPLLLAIGGARSNEVEIGVQ